MGAGRVYCKAKVLKKILKEGGFGGVIRLYIGDNARDIDA